MKRKIAIVVIVVSMIFFSCNRLESKLQGGWIIEKAYYNNKPVLIDFFSNSFDLNKGDECILPIAEIRQRHTSYEHGIWTTYRKNGIDYLKIQTANKVFNRNFVITNLKNKPDASKTGLLLSMTLSSDSLKMECVKIPY